MFLKLADRFGGEKSVGKGCEVGCRDSISVDELGFIEDYWGWLWCSRGLSINRVVLVGLLISAYVGLSLRGCNIRSGGHWTSLD